MFSPPWQSMQIHRGASSQCSHRRRCVFACLGWQIVVALNKIFHKSYLRPIVVWSTGTASTDKLNRTNDCGSASMPRERSTGRILTRSVCFSYHDVIVRNHKICIYSVLDFYLRRRYRIVYIVNIFFQQDFFQNEKRLWNEMHVKLLSCTDPCLSWDDNSLDISKWYSTNIKIVVALEFLTEL